MWTLRLRVWSGNLLSDAIVGLDTEASAQKYVSLLLQALAQAFPGATVQAELEPGVNDTWEGPADVVSLDLVQVTTVSLAPGDPTDLVREVAAAVYWQGRWHVLNEEWKTVEDRVRRPNGPPPGQAWRMLPFVRDIDDDVLTAVRTIAADRATTTGRVLSELARRALACEWGLPGQPGREEEL